MQSMRGGVHGDARRLATLAAVGIIVLGGCGSPGDEVASPSSGSTSVPAAVTVTATTAASTSTAAPATGAATTVAPPSSVDAAALDSAAEVDALLARLQVAPESHAEGYDRDDWPHWSTQPDGCSTRERVLIDESRSVPQIDAFGCKVLIGDWFSAYDGEITEDPGDLDIDHVVALAEAHRSGGWAWDEARREAFANDLGSDGSLIAVSAASNRIKSDRDPASWQPSRDEAWCGYATDWVQVKVRWGLTADQDEVDALRNMLRRCTDPVTTAPTAPTPAPAPAPPPVRPAPPAVIAVPPPQTGGCDASYPTICVPPAPPDLGCGDIPQHGSFPVLPPDPHGFDGNDDDGLGCESN